MPDHPTCNTCRFWEGMSFGICRRNPPVPGSEVSGDIKLVRSWWPETHGTLDWCGEHRPLDKEETGHDG